MGIVAENLFGYRVAVNADGSTVPTRNRIRVEGAGVFSDDEAHSETVLTVGGAGQDATFDDLTASSLTLGSSSDYFVKPQTAVSTTTNSTANLLDSAVAIPAGKSVRIKFTVHAAFFTANNAGYFCLVGVAVYGRIGSGSAGLAWAKNVADESNVPTYPWALGASATTVTGAANNGSGLVRLAVASSAGYAVGQTITVASVGGTTEANGQWIVDAVSDSTHIDLRGSTFTHAWTSGGTVTPNGTIGLSLSSNAVQLQATGIKGAPWLQGESVHRGDIRHNAAGTYLYLDNGTTLGSGSGPSGASGTDNGVNYERISTNTDVPITWKVWLEVYTG